MRKLDDGKTAIIYKTESQLFSKKCEKEKITLYKNGQDLQRLKSRSKFLNYCIMNTNKIIMPILGFVAVTSLLDLQEKCIRDGSAFFSEIEGINACDACQCCVGCVYIDENDK